MLESSYRITQAGEGCDWQAFNSAQGVRSTFTVHEGVRIDGGDADSAPWGLNLALESWGRPGRLVPVEAAEPVPTGRRVEYCRGPLTEWYVNDERGLVQGFTVQAAPEGDGPLAWRSRSARASARRSCPAGATPS